MAREMKVRALVAQGLLVLTLCALFSFISGFVLEGMVRHLELLPGLVVMIPPLIDLRGNVGSALGSRLGTALHMGIIEPRLVITDELRANILSSIILSAVASAAIGILSFAICTLTGTEAIGLGSLLAIAVISGISSGAIITSVTVAIAMAAHKRGWDPDNVTGPAMTTIGDIVTITCIYLTVIALW